VRQFPASPGTVLTIGNFDGAHLGHQAVFARTKEVAKRLGASSVALTFKPHSQMALRPESAPKLLMTYEEKAEAILATGVDFVVEEPFSRELSQTPAETFFREYLLGPLSPRAIVVGYDFAFGSDRQGSQEKLEELCATSGVEIEILQPFRLGGEVVSSTAIRRAIAAGEMERATAMLGRPFFYRGVVERGEGRGRAIGFPTANLAMSQKVVVPLGVYACTARVDGRAFEAVTNVGVRPTFARSQAESPADWPALIEVHLLDTTQDLYGKTLEVDMRSFLRPERKFSGVEELKVHIAKDVTAARARIHSDRR